MSTRADAGLEFNPPSGHGFEPEFLGHPPRTIPDELDQGPHGRRLKARIVGLATAGVVCLAVARAPGIDVLLGALTTLCWCFMANAWLDTSAARPVPAKVEAMTQTTHVFVIREYEIEFSLAGSDQRHKLLTTPEELNRFHSDQAVAQVREGRFGWPWVEAVLPGP